MSYITTAKRLEGMITVNYRLHSIMEQDILVGVLLAMHMGNDIPAGERGCAHKWCPVRNTLSHTACTVTKVSARCTTRGHCRQDIPLGTYDRKSGRWTLKGNHKEVDKLMSLIRKGDDVSLAVLEKIRAAPWKARPPNVRTVIDRFKERDDPMVVRLRCVCRHGRPPAMCLPTFPVCRPLPGNILVSLLERIFPGRGRHTGNVGRHIAGGRPSGSPTRSYGDPVTETKRPTGLARPH